MNFVKPSLILVPVSLATVFMPGAGVSLAQERGGDSRTTEQIRDAAVSKARRSQAKLDRLLEMEAREAEFADRAEAVARRSLRMHARNAKITRLECKSTFCKLTARFDDRRNLDAWLAEMAFQSPFSTTGRVFEQDNLVVAVYFARGDRQLPAPAD